MAGPVLRLILIATLTSCALASSAAGQSLLTASDRATYEAAFEQIEAEEYGTARLLAGKAENPMLGKVIRWLDLSRTRKDDEPPGDFAELEIFLEQNPDWPARHGLLRAAERAMPASLSAHRVRAWFEDHPPVSVDGILRFAEALNATGETARATALLRGAWVDLDFSEEQELAFRQLYAGLPTRDDEIARLERLLWQRKSSAARRQAARVGGDYSLLADARLRLAGRRAGVDQAVRRVPANLQDDPGLVYDRAVWRQQKGRVEGVIELLDPPRAEVPYPDKWWRLRRWAARKALDQGKHQTAYRIASAHGLESGLGFAEGEWLAGWIALRFIKDPTLAYQHFTRLYDRVSSPISKARGAHWAGEAAAAKGSQEAAARWHGLAAQEPTTYYGQLSARWLGQTIDITLPAAIDPNLEVRAEFGAGELVYVIRLLGELGQRKVQQHFLHHLRLAAQTASDFQLIAELAQAQGRPDIALRTAKDARLAGFTLPDLLYPEFEPRHADGLDPALMLALIRQESQFYSEAVSPAGARGLMQLMPATARRVAMGLKLSYRSERLTADPSFNMRLGSTYLGQLLERFDGSAMLALAGYNAGPHRVDQWIKRYGDPRGAGADPIDWAERIPFDETRNYVQRILETVPVYRKQLSQRRVSLPLDPASAEVFGSE
ncbi:MAG: lytic transglycosylase domain-containing protein [Rhodospirillales bacterium]|nr:lytic transglycosylase domain-containing protein [Rhodospirillales bacterium]